MKKSVVYIIVGILAISLAAGAIVSAAPGDGPRQPWGPMKQVNLTDAQKQEMGQLHQQMLDLRKQMIQKRVEFGQLTQDQAKQIITRMDERAKYAAENGFSGGFGRGFRGRCPGNGRGPGGGFGPGAQQNVK